MFSPSDDATVVAALQEKVGNKTIEEQFRDQAELIDRRFLERNRQWDVRFSGMEKGVSALKKDMTIVREGVGILLKRRR